MDAYKAEQDAARKVVEAERALKEQQGFHVADVKRRRHVWAWALEQAMLDIDQLNDDARDMRGDLFRALEEQVKIRADATFRVGTMAMDLEAARAELASTRAELDQAEDKATAERAYAEELEATLARVRAELEAARAELAAGRHELLEELKGLRAEVNSSAAEAAAGRVEAQRLRRANTTLAAELGKLRAETAGA